MRAVTLGTIYFDMEDLQRKNGWNTVISLLEKNYKSNGNAEHLILGKNLEGYHISKDSE